MRNGVVVFSLFFAVMMMPAFAKADCQDYPDPYYEDINGDGIDGDTALAIFVSVAAGNDANPGTMSQPVMSIAQGISLAIANSKPHVYVAAGTYLGTVTMTNGVSLYGQYDGPPSWGRSNANTTTISGTGTAVFAQNITSETHLEGFSIISGSLFTNYGVRVINGTSQLYIRYNNIQPGAGMNGSPGPSPPPGANGGQGGPGSGGSGGSGGFSSCGRFGGSGGSGITPGNPGAGGTPGGSAGSCGGGSSTSGGNGAFGINGSAGNHGGGGAGYSLGGGLVLAMNGNTGTNGNPGNGGGGGGGGGISSGFLCTGCSSLGGGGGGAGGCGGAGAPGGQGGGGSIGVLVVNGSAVIDGNNITTGAGGQGGNGGTGGNGGSGGTGGPGAFLSNSCAARFGGNGGNGGNGGSGGHGGGGAGGASIGILISSAELVRVGSTNSYVIGPGGGGGFSSAFTGAPGVSASVVGSSISQTPEIDAAIPSSGPSFMPVVIAGSGFDPTPGNNEVCFGTAAASVSASTADSIYTEVPAGAATARIKVTKNYLEAYCPNPFTVVPACAATKGDMNASGGLSPADVVLMLNCVFLASGSCDLCFADVNCSGGLSPADVVIELNMVFLSAPPGC